MDDKVATDFMTICERTGVWAALSERSYGGIGFDSDGILSGLIKAKADVRSTKKYAKVPSKIAPNSQIRIIFYAIWSKYFAQLA